MESQTSLGLDEVLAHIAGGIASAVSERAGEPPEMRRVRARAAALAIQTFAPRDAIEAMIAGHCVLFHELIVDAVPDALRGGTETTRRATRSNIVAMDRAFGNNLTRLERHRKRLAKATDANAIAVQARRQQTATVRAEPDNASLSETLCDPIPENIAAAAEATMPLDEADPGVAAQTAKPAADWQAEVAARMAGLNRQARRELSRQARKRLGRSMAKLANADAATTRNGSVTTASATTAG